MQHVSAFIDDLETEHTQRAYRTDLTNFFAHVAEDSSDLRVDHVTSADIRDFLRAMREKELSYATRRRRVSAIRAFYDWLVKRDLASGNPARDAGIQLRRMGEEGEESLRFLEKEELETLVATAGESDRTGPRDQGLILVIVYAALRRSEVAALNIEHVRPLGRHWVIDVPSSSGARGGFVKIPELAASAVQRIVEMYDEEEGPLWRSASNRNRGNRMSPDAIYKCIRNHGREAGLGTIDIETLRRSGLRLASASGARPVQIQSQARLQEVASAVRYFDSEPEEARLQNTATDHIHLDVDL